MLKTEQNTKEVEKNVLFGARKAFPKRKYERENITAVFEHEQWWIRFYDLTEEKDRTFSVCDASGINTYNGFSFEEV